jgi:hypothetical protein
MEMKKAHESVGRKIGSLENDISPTSSVATSLSYSRTPLSLLVVSFQCPEVQQVKLGSCLKISQGTSSSIFVISHTFTSSDQKRVDVEHSAGGPIFNLPSLCHIIGYPSNHTAHSMFEHHVLSHSNN